MDVTTAIETRRAYRSLAPAPITEDFVADLARHAQLAPSCFNHQPWRFVFADDAAALERLRGAMSRGNEWTFAASLVVAVVSRKDLDCVVAGREYYGFDTGLATAFLILRATELGWVAHPIAGFDAGRVRETLGIPAAYDVITLVNVGRRAPTLNPALSEKQIHDEGERPPRKAAAEFAFRNAWPAAVP